MEKKEKRKKVKGYFLLFLKFFIVFVLLLFLILFPDILFALRNLICNIKFFSQLICKDIDSLKYIELMLMPLLSCITIIISVLALITTKSSAKTQEISQNAKIFHASINVVDAIRTNMKVVYDLSKNTGDIRELVIEKSVLENAVLLYAAKLINREDLEFFKKFMEKVSEIDYYHSLHRDEDKKRTIRDFYDKYFIDNNLTYLGELNNFINRIEF